MYARRKLKIKIVPLQDWLVEKGCDARTTYVICEIPRDGHVLGSLLH